MNKPAIGSLIKTPARRAFLLLWLKKALKFFAITWMLIAWAFQAGAASSGLATILFSLFFVGGGMYLTWDNGLSDEEILSRGLP